MVRISTIIFDLDNVLYNERDYIHAAYREIAAFISERYRLQKEQIYQKLLIDLQTKTSLYPHLFDDLLADLGLNKSVLPNILNIYANTNVDLKLFEGAKHLLKTLKKQKIRLGLVTNGNVETQKNKVRLLGIEKYFDAVVYARDLGKEKPNPAVYRVTLETLRSKPEETICIGDNPYTDFLGAKKLGIRTVRYLNGEFKEVKLSREYEADLAVRNLEELAEIIAQSN